MVKKVEISIGDVFHELTVIEEVERWVYPSGDTRRQFIMQCSCGSPPKKMLISNFKTGSTKSCGCYNVKRMTTHGMHKTRQYQCWADMKTRCDSPTNEFYDYYGGRGITYCEKWKTFEGFWEDMAEGYSDVLTINRRDNDGNYCKENCEWDNRNFQGHMRRKLRDTYLSVIGGIYDAKNDTMTARIKKNGKGVHLGNYKTEEEIAQAYDYASEIIYGDRPNKTVHTEDKIKLRVDKFMSNIGKDMRVSGCENENALFTKEQIKEICILLDKGMFQKDIAKLYNTEQTTISSISRGKTYAKESGRAQTFKIKEQHENK